jgi:hypothetical protein
VCLALVAFVLAAAGYARAEPGLLVGVDDDQIKGQAEQLGAALRLAYCQPRVTAFFNFLLVDEPSLSRWQSGLLWADWKRKPAFAAYRTAIADVRAGTVDCSQPARATADVEQRGDDLMRQASARLLTARPT